MFNQKQNLRASLNCRLGFLEQKRLTTLLRIKEGQRWLEGYLKLIEELHGEALKELRSLKD